MRPGRFLTAGLLAFCLLLTPTPGVADAIPGAPLKQSFGVGETKVTPGHLALATGPNGELFVGNVEGVLIYDGVTWSTAELTGLSPARALAPGADGRIYVGGYDTFGRLARNGEGRYVYEELLGQAGLRDAQRHVGIVWEVLARPEGVYFRAESNLHFLPYEGGAGKRWPLPPQARFFYTVGDELWLRIQDKGLVRFDEARFPLVPGGETFADMPVAGILPWEDGVLVVASKGLYLLDEAGARALPGEGSELVRNTRSYVVQPLGDGSFVVGSRDGDLFRLDRNLRLREQLDLGAFAIHALALDHEGGLWVATEGDLHRLSLPSPWSFIGAEQGLDGTPMDFAWYQDALWVATSRDVQRLRQTPMGLKAEAMGWSNYEAHALLATEAGLLVGLREGLLVLEPGAARPRALRPPTPEGSVYAIRRSRFETDLVYAYAANELLLVRLVDGHWQIQATVPLQGVSINGLEELAPGEIWLGDTRGPVQRWRLDTRTGQVLERTRFDDSRGLVLEGRSGTTVYQLDGQLRAVSGKAGFRRDGERFVPDAAPPFTLVDRPNELVVEETPLGTFAYTRRQLWHRPAGSAEWQAMHPASEQAIGYASLRVNDDGVLRVATWSGLLQYNPESPAPTPRPLQLGMETVVARSQDGRLLRLPTVTGDQPVEVPPGYSLNLRFSMVSMESGAEFRYLLHGVTPEWSAWTDRDLFIRALPAGDYALEVQARTLTGRQPPSMIYRFRVLPRWYEQWWAIALGLLAVAGLASGLTVWSVRRRTERYLLENRRLEARIAERTHELEELNRRLAELVTEDALTGVANRRALENGLRREWYRCLDQRRPLSVLMIDVDHFKAYNDAHGHLEGDVQLRRIAQRLAAEHDPQRELLSRYGGEEFALLLPGVHREEAARRAEQIRAAISASDIGMTVSIGVAGFEPDLQADPESLLRRADAALYAAKRGGRNRVETDAG